MKFADIVRKLLREGDYHNSDGSIKDDKQLEYLLNVKPKYTFDQLLLRSRPLINAFKNLNIEDSIDKWDDKEPISKLKDNFLNTIKGSEFERIFAKKWQNHEKLLKNLFHTLFYYHHSGPKANLKQTLINRLGQKTK